MNRFSFFFHQKNIQKKNVMHKLQLHNFKFQIKIYNDNNNNIGYQTIEIENEVFFM
jgi:hypothetical protein